MWISYAERPLRPKELQHALATEHAYERKADIYIHPIEVILEACGNLVVVESGVVRPIHYSVQEFLKSGRHEASQGYLQQNLLKPSTVHASLASVCVKYILLGEITEPFTSGRKLWQHVRDVAFACYATHYFDQHLMKSVDVLRHLMLLLEKLLKQDELCLAAVLQLRMASDDYSRSWQSGTFREINFPVSTSTIIYATRLFDIDEIKKQYLEASVPLYALHHASVIRSESAVRHLLELDVEVKEADTEGANALYYAALGGDTTVLNLFLEHGADLSTEGGKYGNALQAACYKGHLEVVKVLLAKDADVNAQCGFYGNALQAACLQSHLEVVKALLAKDADINAQGGTYGTALQAAVYCNNNNKEVFDLLIREGAIESN